MTVVLMPRMQTSRAYEFMRVNPPSIHTMKRHSYHRTAFTIGQDDQHPGQVTGTQLVRLATGDIRKSLYS